MSSYEDESEMDLGKHQKGKIFVIGKYIVICTGVNLFVIHQKIFISPV